MSGRHVALVTPWQRQGGIATYSERFADALDEAGVRVTPIPVDNQNTSNPLGFIGLLDRIPEDADVVHVQYEAGLFGRLGVSGTGAPAFFLALDRVEPRVVVTLHEVHGEHHHRGPLGDYLLRGRDHVIERLALRAADVTVVHTKEARRVLEGRHGTRFRVERMLHPTDADAEPVAGETAKAELGVSGPVALTFGFVEEKKKYEEVIRLLPEFPDLTYVIAGGLREGEGEAVLESCRQTAENLGVADRVHHTGYVEAEDVSVVFSAADVVVLPYERVSQSGVLNEALAYESPVVASSLPAFDEIEDEFGCVVTYADGEELRSRLDSVLSDPSTREQLLERADEYTEEVSWENFAVRTRALYEP